jgi:FMN phosphatase YigB (HAD superfamily)
MPIRAALFDLGNTLVSYYQPSEFLRILRRSLQACLLTLGRSPLDREAETDLVHQALELNQDVGWRKPHPTPFRRALEMLDISAQEAVFVGDDPAWDLEGAGRAGLRAILLGARPQRTLAQVTVAASLPDVLAEIDLLNSTASTGPQPALA